MRDLYGNEMERCPCEVKGDDGMFHCPYESTYTGYESEMCRVMCGQGVDE